MMSRADPFPLLLPPFFSLALQLTHFLLTAKATGGTYWNVSPLSAYFLSFHRGNRTRRSTPTIDSHLAWRAQLTAWLLDGWSEWLLWLWREWSVFLYRFLNAVSCVKEVQAACSCLSPDSFCVCVYTRTCVCDSPVSCLSLVCCDSGSPQIVSIAEIPGAACSCLTLLQPGVGFFLPPPLLMLWSWGGWPIASSCCSFHNGPAHTVPRLAVQRSTLDEQQSSQLRGIYLHYNHHEGRPGTTEQRRLSTGERTLVFS